MNTGLVVVGYVLAVLIPIAGFILGIVAVTRPDRRTRRHGIWIIVVAVAVVVLYAVLVASTSSPGIPSR